MGGKGKQRKATANPCSQKMIGPVSQKGTEIKLSNTHLPYPVKGYLSGSQQQAFNSKSPFPTNLRVLRFLVTVFLQK